MEIHGIISNLFHMQLLCWLELALLVIKSKRVWVTEDMPLGLLLNTKDNTMKWDAFNYM